MSKVAEAIEAAIAIAEDVRKITLDKFEVDAHGATLTIERKLNGWEVIVAISVEGLLVQRWAVDAEVDGGVLLREAFSYLRLEASDRLDAEIARKRRNVAAMLFPVTKGAE